MPGKRSNPTDLLRQKMEIIKDMESRLPKDDHEDPGSVMKKKGSPPVRRGAMVTGFKKPNTTA